MDDLPTLYRIRDWDRHFENNKPREREKCSFCCIPNKQDGLGYGLLLREPNGEALYGAFVAVVLVCSKHRNRKGWITADGLPAGCPLSARQLSVKCQFSAQTIQRMLEVVSTNEIGWIEAVPAECPPSARAVPAECPRREGKEGKERRGGNGNLSPSERISLEQELNRIGRELEKLGSANDYDKTHPYRKRIPELQARQVELRSRLGVVA